MLPVFTDAADIAITETGGIGRVIPIDHYFGAVVAIQSIAGSEPDKSPAVLEYGFYGAVGQSLLVRKMCKCQFWRLGGESDCANKRHYATEEIIFHDGKR